MASHVAADRVEEGSAIARRYGRAAANEWQRLLAHFDLGDGFALIVLVVPDRDGAALCHRELERLLAAQKQRLQSYEPANHADLVRVAAVLPGEIPAPDIGAVWIEAAVVRSAPDFATWERAWRAALEALNQQRNPLRQTFHIPIVIVVPPWVVPLFRECAPDLWSIRSQVVRIEPAPALGRERSELQREPDLRRGAPVPTDTPDPELALREAERLRGLPDRIRDRALLLARAGRGYYGQGRLIEAEAALREAADLFAVLKEPVEQADTLDRLGRAILNQGRAEEAEEAFRRALTLVGEGGDTAVSRGITMHELGRAILDQGRAAEAEKTFRRALALKEEGGATAVSRGITMDNLGRAILDQGRAAEAEADVPPRPGPAGGRRRHRGLARHHDARTRPRDPGSRPGGGGGGNIPPRPGPEGGRRRHRGLARHHDGQSRPRDPGSRPGGGGGGDVPPRPGPEGGRRRHRGLARHHDGHTRPRDPGSRPGGGGGGDVPPRPGPAEEGGGTAVSRGITMDNSAARSWIKAGRRRRRQHSAAPWP